MGQKSLESQRVTRGQLVDLLLPEVGVPLAVARTHSLDPADWPATLNAGIATRLGLAVVACGSDRRPTLPSPATEWSRFTPLERIQRLERKQGPKTPGFDPFKELAFAVAEFYCHETACSNKSPQAIARDVILLPTDQFVARINDESLKYAGKPLTAQELGDTRQKRLETVTLDNQVLINKGLFDTVVAKTRSSPEVVRQLNGGNLETTMLKSVLFHAFSHTNQTREQLDIPPIFLRAGSTTFVYNKMRGFQILGATPDGKPTSINSHEPPTELIGAILATRTGNYLAVEPAYYAAAQYMNTLNGRAKISHPEFFDYANGKRPLREFLERWSQLKKGDPDIKTGAVLLAIIGLYLQGAYSEQEMVKQVDKILTSP